MKYIRILSAVAFLAYAGIAGAELRELQNEALGAVTAGTGNTDPTGTAGHAAGGTIVANGSSANVNDQSELVLSTDAQREGRGINIVNAASSLVAQGSNIWDGRYETSAAEIESKVEQSNLVMQSETTRSASLQGYERDSHSVDSSWIYDTANNTDTIDLVSDVMVNTSHTVLGQNVNAGLGVGVAGRVDIDLGPVEIDVGLSATSTIDIGVGVNGEINLPWPLGTMDASGQLDMLITNEGSFTIDLSTPEISIDAIGSVCYTKLGVCTASADENSTYVTNTTHDETHIIDTQGALSVDELQAEYIVIDDSTLEIVSGNSLILETSSQANFAAVNAVNAVGSLVANGVNVSRTTITGEAKSPLVLSQSNVVMQGM